MHGFERIVVGLDEGEYADSAVVTALHLSRLVDAALEVVHTVRVRAERPWFADEQTLAWLEDAVAKDAIHSRCEHLWKLLQPSAVTRTEIEQMLHVAVGRPSAVLSSRGGDGSLLLLGGHRHRGLLDFGSTTREVISQLQGPMWVQGSAPWTEIRRILVPVDLSPGSEAVMAQAKSLARAAGAAITALHCLEPLAYPHDDVERLDEAIRKHREREQQEFASFLEKSGTDTPPVEALTESGDPAATVLSLQEGHDLIVMGTHGYSGMSRLLLGSHAHRVLRETETPVVVVPQPPQ